MIDPTHDPQDVLNDAPWSASKAANYVNHLWPASVKRMTKTTPRYSYWFILLSLLSCFHFTDYLKPV